MRLRACLPSSTPLGVWMIASALLRGINPYLPVMLAGSTSLIKALYCVSACPITLRIHFCVIEPATEYTG
ncbi:hypothetical protein D3C85_1292640 [compost metagenome]